MLISSLGMVDENDEDISDVGMMGCASHEIIEMFYKKVDGKWTFCFNILEVKLIREL